MADYDPYDMNNYYTPNKGNIDTKQQNKKTFNPYETQNNKVLNQQQSQQQEDLPEFVDLTKDMYSQKPNINNFNQENDEDIPLLDG
jgi:hypothetical protein